MLNPIVKIHGGQHKVKKWVIDHFPHNYENMRYLETCVGGGSIILNKKRSVGESICDIDYNLFSIYRAVQHNTKLFQDDLREIPYSQESFTLALQNKYSQPANEYVLRRMSRGGLMRHFAWSNRLRGGRPGDENAWINSIENLEKISQRLQGVEISHCGIMTALRILAPYHDFIYIDPPFLPETRVSKKCYRHEMTTEDHEDMLMMISGYGDFDNHKKYILLAGYSNQLYDHYLKGWNTHKITVTNHSGQTKKKGKRELCLWANF